MTLFLCFLRLSSSPDQFRLLSPASLVQPPSPLSTSSAASSPAYVGFSVSVEEIIDFAAAAAKEEAEALGASSALLQIPPPPLAAGRALFLFALDDLALTEKDLLDATAVLKTGKRVTIFAAEAHPGSGWPDQFSPLKGYGELRSVVAVEVSSREVVGV